MIPTHPYPGSHYATFPPELCTRPIKSCCPERVCLTCGQPSRRIVEPSERYAGRANAGKSIVTSASREQMRQNAESRSATMNGMTAAEYVTVGWTDCGHDNWRRGVTLDPFAGSGTTLAVATGLGRDAIGIDLDERNAWLARERVGMFLDIDMPDGDPETVT